MDLNGNCTFCNRACVDLLGYDETGQLLGKNMHDLIHHTRPDGRPYLQEECKIYLASEKSERSHVTDEVLWRSDGTHFDSEYWSHPVRSNGELVGSVVTFIDITERKRMEALNRAREDQLREAQRIAGIGSWEVALGSTAATWSEGLYRILGRDLSLGPPTFDTLSQFYTPEGWGLLEAAIAKTIETGAPHEIELEMIRDDGGTCWTTTRGEAVRGPDGAVVGLRGTVLDITECRRAELAHQEREAQLREAQRIAGIGSWERELGTNAISWSEGMYRILGRDLSQGPPDVATLSRFFTPESWDRRATAMARLVETGEPSEVDLEMIREDGSTCWTTARGEAVRGPDGAVVRLRGTIHDITERKRAEVEYQKREAELKEAQRIAGIGSWERSLDSETTNWSEGLYRILGRDLSQGPPKFSALSQFYTPESWERARPAIARVIETGEPYELELAMVRDDGSICWTTTRGEAVRGSDGAVVGLRGAVHDITERKRAEKAYQEREAQLKEAQRIAGIGSWERPLDRDAINWSEGLYRILGRDLSQGPPKVTELSQVFKPESWELLRPAIANTIETGAAFELELEMIRDDGDICWITNRGEAVLGPDGKVVGLRGTVHDVTERKRAEMANQEREAQLREAQRIAGIGSWERELGSETINWSEGLYRILGRDLSQGPPNFTTLAQVFTPESWELVRPAIANAIETGESFELVLAMIRDDGDICWVTNRGEAVLGPDGKVVGLRGTVHDITERKRLQASTAQADRLSSMGLLAAGVAHEINNPLTYLLYNVESLAEDLQKIAMAVGRSTADLRKELGDTAFAAVMGEDAEVLDRSHIDAAAVRAREAVEASERIKVLIRSLSTFSRVEKGAETWVDVHQAIESAITMAQNEMRYRARLVKDLHAVPDVWASAGKLSQVFLNLLINAAHSIDEGHVEDNIITIRTWTEGDDVFAEVGDTGNGISEQDLGRIFEPFFSTKQIGKGSGLGLAICNNLVTEFGGSIQVDSEIGKGSRFIVRLPVTSTLATPRGDHSMEQVRRTPTVGGRVLVVDDEPAIRQILKRLLGQVHEVFTADSGLAGRQILEHDQSFDVILCDLMMSEMTGMELHEWLGAHHPELSRRLVFITGGIFTPRAAEYLATVSNLQIEKPFDSVQLSKLVADLVEATREPTPGMWGPTRRSRA